MFLTDMSTTYIISWSNLQSCYPSHLVTHIHTHTRRQAHAHHPLPSPIKWVQYHMTGITVGARGSVKLAFSVHSGDARVRRLRWGCCIWQGLVLHHVFHSRFASSCGHRWKRLSLRRPFFGPRLSCTTSSCGEFMNRLMHSECKRSILS